MNVVWFKRDLRLVDHQPLVEALLQPEPILCLHIIEPDLWAQVDMSGRQYDFYIESLRGLQSECDNYRIPLCIRVGSAVNILQHLHESNPISSLYSHQETWNDWSYQRDKSIKKWTDNIRVSWKEFQQFGVFRPLKNRDGWARRWEQLMNKPISRYSFDHPFVSLPSDSILSKSQMKISEDPCQYRLKGGRHQALKYLKSFFADRGCFYTKAMSSPNTAPTACSRLSPYISFGCISMKEIHHYSSEFQGKEAFNDRSNRSAWKQATRSFTGRLRWHCHFIQKLEDQPAIEYASIHSAYNTLTYHDPMNLDRLDRWKNGQTGFPLVDACMRALNQWGWLNFRMRAMVMSFAAHHLWMHWRQPAHYLAKQFVDYEPGIHYSQCQMQAGTTGINSIRIYNPIKQSHDHDPDGQFIRHWIPELENCPLEYIHSPWEWLSSDNRYIDPIVDEKGARKHAADQLYSLRRHAPFKEEAAKIAEKHASRRSSRTTKQARPLISEKQLSFLEPNN